MTAECTNHSICDCFLERMRKLESISMKARRFVMSEDGCDAAFEELKKACEELYGRND